MRFDFCSKIQVWGCKFPFFPVEKDIQNTEKYRSFGYKVYRIPFFIQLTNTVVKQLFGREVNEVLFDENIPSMGPKGKNTPAFLCGAGIIRMAKEFHSFPEQYRINLKALKSYNNEYLTGATLLEQAYNFYNS